MVGDMVIVQLSRVPNGFESKLWHIDSIGKDLGLHGESSMLENSTKHETSQEISLV